MSEQYKYTFYDKLSVVSSFVVDMSKAAMFVCFGYAAYHIGMSVFVTTAMSMIQQ